MPICRRCMRIWKKSVQGKAARIANGNTWKGMQGKWPSHLEHTGKGDLCLVHKHEREIRRHLTKENKQNQLRNLQRKQQR